MLQPPRRPPPTLKNPLAVSLKRLLPFLPLAVSLRRLRFLPLAVSLKRPRFLPLAVSLKPLLPLHPLAVSLKLLRFLPLVVSLKRLRPLLTCCRWPPAHIDLNQRKVSLRLIYHECY